MTTGQRFRTTVFVLLSSFSTTALSSWYMGGGGHATFASQYDFVHIIEAFNDTLFETPKGSANNHTAIGWQAVVGFQDISFLPNFRFQLLAADIPHHITHPNATAGGDTYLLEFHLGHLFFPKSNLLNPLLTLSAGGIWTTGSYAQSLPTTSTPEHLAYHGPGFVVAGAGGVVIAPTSWLSFEWIGGYRYGMVPQVTANSASDALFPEVEASEVIQLKPKNGKAREFRIYISGWFVALTALVHF